MARTKLIQVKVSDKEKDTFNKNAALIGVALELENTDVSNVARHVFLNMDRAALLSLIRQQKQEAVIA